MLITNKYKQSKKNDDKRGSARRIRYMPVEPVVRTTPKRHDQNACPVCGERIHMTAAGGRRKHLCSHCGASLNKQLTCASCGTNRVWQGKSGIACRGCGTAYRGSLVDCRLASNKAELALDWHTSLE